MATDPKVLIEMIRGMRVMLAQNPDADPEDLLAMLAEVRKMVPPDLLRTPKDHPDQTSRLDGAAEEDFAWDALEEATVSLHAELAEGIAAKKKLLFESMLDIYYGVEEAVRDPANAHLIPHLEQMRASYLRGYGHEIPTREETEARRRMEALGINGV